MTELSYGSLSFDSAKFPAKTVEALVRRGLAHYLGNEQASKVVSKAKQLTNERFAAYQQANPDGDKTILDFELSADERAELKAGFVEAASKALFEGTIGVSAPRQPSVDPLDAEMERIAKAQVTTVLKANGIKPPKADEAVTFGDGSKKTMDEMIESRLANPKFAEAIKSEAERNLKAKAKAKAAKEKALAGAKVEGAALPDDLGL